MARQVTVEERNERITKRAEAEVAKSRLKYYKDLRPTLLPDIGGRRTRATPTLDQYDGSGDW